MLNGKFYTGLPPKMMERSPCVQNRLESHLFWPDDSRIESATEMRTRRRGSLQAEPPKIASAQYSHSLGYGSENEVDTKERFHKEFAKSSIKFCDNIQEEETNQKQPLQAMRKSYGRNSLKQDITLKPTATKLETPHSSTRNDEYAAIKNKQAFASKIQFYDYAEDNDSRNNRRKPKLDMNDKKDVERNTKNSPKLQVKGIVRGMRLAEEPRNGDHFVEEVNNTDYERPRQTGRYGARVIRNDMHEESREVANDRSDSYNDEHNEANYNERYLGSRNLRTPSKRILKYPTRDEPDNDLEQTRYVDSELERKTRNLRVGTSPKKHVTYGDEIYEYEVHNDSYHAENDENGSFREQRTEFRTAARNATANDASPTFRSRSETKSPNRQTAGNSKQRQSNIPDYAPNNINGEELYQSRSYSADHSGRGKSSNITLIKATSNKNNTRLNNQTTYMGTHEQQQQQQQQQVQQRQQLPKMSAPAANEPPALATSPTLDTQKHLRSNLCFYGGEIVANNRGRAGANGTPTSEANSRRSARSAATTRRICVGLPD